MLTEIEYKKLGWHSRRGMLELDLLLVPFVEHHLREQLYPDQLLYRKLLAEEDQDLFAWLVQRVSPPADDLDRIINIIRNCVVHGKQSV
jgi:antitoxin CptB